MKTCSDTDTKMIVTTTAASPLPALALSVRSLAEFLMRSGSITPGWIGAERAAEGVRAHQAMQRLRKAEAKERGGAYTSERFLKMSVERGGFRFDLEGRADGVDEDVPRLEEIKSTYSPPGELDVGPEHWHWAQLKCYAYMYCKLGDIDRAVLRLTYCRVDSPETRVYDASAALNDPADSGRVGSPETRVFDEQYTIEALEAFFFELLDKYLAFARADAMRVAERNETAAALGFPFEAYRRGQREMCVAVYAAVKQGKKLFAQAPTGVGKTVSALFPSIKALAEGHIEKIFYATAKTPTRKAAEQALNIMAAGGLRIRSVTLTAKDKLCPLEVRNCSPEGCERANGHFDRVNAAVLDAVTHETIIARETVERYALRHNVCPFEFQLDVSVFCDVVVCDYNHVYDPRARLKRFFADGGKFAVLNDEAHNLADRAREMFSATVSRKAFSGVAKGLEKKTGLYASVRNIVKYFRQRYAQIAVPADGKTDAAVSVSKSPPEDLCALLCEFLSEADGWLKTNQFSAMGEAVLELYFLAGDFIRIAEGYDERYVTYAEKNAKERDLRVRLYCLDPSRLLAKEQSKSRASVFFSATLTPLTYFRDVLGGGEKDFLLKLASPYDRENLCVLVDRGISTKLKNRENSNAPVAERIYEMASAKAGNYFAFFPSYAYLSAVFAIFTEKYPQIEARIQTQAMSEEERDGFLENFSEIPKDPRAGSGSFVAFAVLGGVFSEGIDLAGDRLIGAAVVGVGLPLISTERDVLSEYYQSAAGAGFPYAYMYPGMNKVLQAAGRVIRSETDRGALLLLDGRFLRGDYRELFPWEWGHFETVGRSGEVEKRLREFWKQ